MVINRTCNSEKGSTTGKLAYLEGIRGLMAFNVVLCHFICIYYPQMYFPDFEGVSKGFLCYFSTTPLSILINGNIAVQYFFVLTGFLVGKTFLQGPYLHAAFPAAASIDIFGLFL